MRVADTTKDRLKIYSCSSHGFAWPQTGPCCGSPSIWLPLPMHTYGGDGNMVPPVPPYQTTISLVNACKALWTGKVLSNGIIPTPSRVHSALQTQRTKEIRGWTSAAQPERHPSQRSSSHGNRADPQQQTRLSRHPPLPGIIQKLLLKS